MPQTALIADVAALIATLTLAECLARFAGPDCCVSPVLDIGEAVASPHHRGRGLVRRAEDGALQALVPGPRRRASPGHPAVRLAGTGPTRTRGTSSPTTTKSRNLMPYLAKPG